MSKTLDVAIVGYGTAGQALAVLLSRDGHRAGVRTGRNAGSGRRRLCRSPVACRRCGRCS